MTTPSSIETFVSLSGAVVVASDRNMVTIAPRRGLCSARFVVLVRGEGQGRNADHSGAVLDAERTATELDKLDDPALAAWVRSFAAGEAAS